jgi:hypothetical protein
MATNPDASQSDSRAAHLSRALELIAAVAKRDAAPEDIVPPLDIAAQLRDQGIDSLELLVSVLARAVRQPEDRRRATRRIDIRHFSQPTPRELITRSAHRPPKIPFVLNGTLYDPNDIRRFDGSELHFVVGPRADELLAFDDRNVIARIWESTYVMSLSGMVPRGGQDAEPRWIAWPPMDHVGAYFWENSGPDGWGEAIYLSPNTGFWDLRRVGHGVLGVGDWNDVISSFAHNQVNVVALYEHVDMQGSSLTSTEHSESSLDYIGWNDRASSCACW